MIVNIKFESKLNPQNRGVKLAKLLGWDAIASIASRSFSANIEVKSVDARIIVIGALIIQAYGEEYDHGTLEIIQENPYI